MDWLRKNKIIIKYPIIKEFIKFCLVGMTNLVIDMSVYYFLTRFLHLYYIVAGCISFVISVTWSFYINRKWTFRMAHDDSSSRYFKFFGANFISIVINLTLLYLMVDFWHWHDITAKLITTVIVAFVNFSLNKYWTFSREDNPEKLVI